MTHTQMPASRSPLPPFEEAEGLGARDAEFVGDLVAVLEKHGNLNRFGLCLLHDHFPLADDEILVETSEPETRTLHTRVEKADGTRHTKPSQWRFLPHGDGERRPELEKGPYQVVQLCTPLDLCPGRDRDGDR
ncbi:hypothetical protein ACFW1F_27760 [Streptomyces bungoensis]|uniref:hypothetical protein n=1 Tax=Streptomyces bungoensis TaxID=285568 RepID=UPI0034165792